MEFETKPHHFHPRYHKEGFFSPMKGTLNKDLPKLFEYIKGDKLLSEDLKF